MLNVKIEHNAFRMMQSSLNFSVMYIRQTVISITGYFDFIRSLLVLSANAMHMQLKNMNV